MLKDNQPNIPFCLNWANENWTRTWDGMNNKILMQQNYGNEKDWENHFNYLNQFFQHKNYIKINGAPLFSIYRIGQVEQLQEMVKKWRELAKLNDLPGLHIIAMMGAFKDSQYNQKLSQIVDGFAEFQPTHANYQGVHKKIFGNLRLIDIEKSWKKIITLSAICKNYYRGFFNGWDNSPRKNDKATIFIGRDKEKFKKYFQQQLKNVEQDENNNKILFFNAWNEWAEQACLEPDNKNNFDYLKIVKNVLKNYE